MRLARLIAVGLLLVACAPRRSASPPPTAPKKAPEREANVSVAASRTTYILRDPSGNPVWEIAGTIRSLVQGKTGAFNLLDAEARSLIPQRDATARLGRMQYRLGASTVLFDRRLYVGAPTRQASLETEQASFDLRARRFTIDGLARARYGPVVLETERMVAEFDLRELYALPLRAWQTTTERRWAAQAAEGSVDPQRQVHLKQVAGRLVSDQITTEFSAPNATYRPDTDSLDFPDGATLRREGFTVTAAAVTWQRATGKLVTRGTTRVVRADVTATGTGATVDLTARTATLDNLRVEARGAVLNAAHGSLAADRTVRLSGVNATLPGGTTVTAPEAVYQPDARTLVLPRGATASRAGATMRADRVTWSAGEGRLVASGNVRLSQGGNTVSGERLTAPADLSSATLTPVRATGGGRSQLWSVSAAGGDWQRGGVITLHGAGGTFRQGERSVYATAASVVYDPATQVVRFEGGFHATSQSEAVQVTADRATYDVRGGVFRAYGHVQARVHGVAIHNREWSYYLGRRDDGRLGESGGESVRQKEPTAGRANKPRSNRGPRREGEAGATGTGDRPGAVRDQGPQVPRAAAADPGAAR